MKRIFTLLTIGLFLSTTTFAEDHENFEFFEQEALWSEDGTATTIKSRMSNGLDVEIKVRNFLDSDKIKLYKAVEILQTVMNSAELKERILNFEYKGEQSFHQNNGMTNQEIFDHLMTGAENLMPEADGVMNFDLTLYTSKNPWSKVKGYTTPDSMRIYLNRKFYRKSSWTAVDVAANLAHEWIHKMGFGHDYYYNDDRPYTVPYAIGYLVAEVAKSMGY